ncbi:unnamed protein product [Arctia plantaginis]|uniref:Uncharacterized protein n=1 Tax=Arctia plantaginis TaxID=874455 RepID=A0A8S0Z7R2_ARCPL|nr:unnamed protein product [Arctia plantaginis]CAB3228305.1 unnamed protein product [Arctia plantaginis]
MRTEVPVFKRCCFCLPLRRSLIAWGYFKLFLAAILLLYCLVGLYQTINVFLHIKYWILMHEIITLTVVIAVVLVDIIVHILFIVGAHKKEVKFLRVYYYYSLTLLGLLLLLYLYWIVLMIRDRIYRYINFFIISAWAVMFLNLLIQAYVILLVRSEIVKLNNIGSFRFVNNAAEAECKLYIEDPHEEIVQINEENEKDENDKSDTDTEDKNLNIA